MKSALLILCALWAFGCAKVSLTTACPNSSIGVGFSLAGSTVGNTAISMLGGIISGGGTAAKLAAAAAPAPTTNATMTYTYFPIFGADSGSLTCVEPPTMTTVVTSPPASILR